MSIMFLERSKKITISPGKEASSPHIVNPGLQNTAGPRDGHAHVIFQGGFFRADELRPGLGL
jgi:hypothetical protein